MLTIHTMALGAYETNCYIVHHPESPECVVIDPGYDPEYILDFMKKYYLTAKAIFLTHGHFDHVGGVKQLAEAFGCPVYIHSAELTLPETMTGGPLYCNHYYDHGDAPVIGGVVYQIFHTPGHTPGCVCIQAENYLFTGDTLFAGSCGRVDFPGSSPEAMERSLAMLAAIPGDMVVLPGHGEISSLMEERRFNPYLKDLL